MVLQIDINAKASVSPIGATSAEFMELLAWHTAVSGEEK